MSHEHDHDHPWFLQHHWENPKQQFEAGKLGMWLFLATEVLLFGGLFCGYWVLRVNHPELYRFGAQYLDTMMGATNTVVLILSSLTMAWAVTAAQQGKQGTLKLMLVLTLLGACGFLVIKYFEYTHKFHEGWYPGVKLYDTPAHAHGFVAGDPVYGINPTLAPSANAGTLPVAESDVPLTLGAEATSVPIASDAPSGFVMDAGHDHETAGMSERMVVDADGHEYVRHPSQRATRPANAHLFFNIYFMMTGLHAVHVILGMGVIIWILWKALKGQFGPDYFTPVDLGGLYWHIVDLIWIFLFPMFYLI